MAVLRLQHTERIIRRDQELTISTYCKPALPATIPSLIDDSRSHRRQSISRHGCRASIPTRGPAFSFSMTIESAGFTRQVSIETDPGAALRKQGRLSQIRSAGPATTNPSERCMSNMSLLCGSRELGLGRSRGHAPSETLISISLAG